jgi:chromosome partitioning protein
MPKGYSFLSKKGGVGKTTLAINCAHALAFSGFRTLLVDLDSQSNLSKHLLARAGEEVRKGVPDIAKILLRRADPLDSRLETGWEGLHLLAGSVELEDLPMFDPKLTREPARLRQVLEPLFPEYDYILVDCPPALNWITRMALMATSQVVVPTQPEAYALQGLEDLVPWLDKMTATAQLFRIVINMHRSQTQLHQTLAGQIEAAYPGRVARQKIRLTIDLAEAARAGLSVFEHAPASSAAQDLYALCFELFGLSSESVRNRIRSRVSPAITTFSPGGTA